LADEPRVVVRRVSRWHSTAAVGGPPNQPDFLNGAVLMDTQLGADALFHRIQSIEQSLGRQRVQRWDARRIDIDLLLYEDLVCETRELRLPHPWMAVRRFVLEPAAEIAPHMLHPLLGWTVGQMAAHLEQAPPRFALHGAFDATILTRLAEATNALLIRDPLVRSAGEEGSASSTTRRVAESEPSPEQPVDRESPDPLLRQAARPSYVQQIEFLERRHRRLTVSPWADPIQPVVCQFWLDESWLTAQSRLNPQEQRSFERQFDARSATVAPPKLLISWFGQGLPPLASFETSTADRYPQLSRTRLESTGVCPWLEIRGSEPDDFLLEAAAAIASMQ
jgi:2-amino-4-hydroxy-6-hydroxymethyldihydropteridine diphosphokinase